MGSRGRGGRRAVGGFGMSLAVVTLLTVGPLALNAATVTSAWRAKVGSAGANGLATIQGYSTGTGAIVLKLTKLRPSTLLPVTLYKGTCSSVGAVLIKFPAIKSTSAGAASRTSSLAASQVNLIKSATKGTGRIAIRIGSSSTGIKCGLFATLYVPPPPPPPAAVAATITVGRGPTDVAISPSGVWVANYYDGTLSHVDPATNSVLSLIDVATSTENLAPWALTYAEGSLWVAVAEYDSSATNITGTSVRRIDPSSGQSIATIKLGKEVDDITASPGSVWVSSFDDGTVSRIDTATNQLSATITIGTGLVGVAYDFGSVWVANEQTNKVLRIDPASNQVVATIATVDSPEGVTTGAGAVWVTNYGTKGQPDGLLTRIDPASNQVTRTIPVGTNPETVSFGGGYVWVALYGEPSVVQVNATTNAVQAKLSTGTVVIGPSGQVVGLFGIAATDHSVWAVQALPAASSSTPPDAGKVIRINY